MNKETINKIVKATGVSAGELVLVHFWGDDSDKVATVKNMFPNVVVG